MVVITPTWYLVFQLENMHSLDSSREADDWEEEAVCVEVLKHALNRLPIDAE